MCQRCSASCGKVIFLILPGVPIARQQSDWLLALHCVLDIILKTTHEAINKEAWRKIRPVATHQLHLVFISIDIIIHSIYLFQVLQLVHWVYSMCVRETFDHYSAQFYSTDG